MEVAKTIEKERKGGGEGSSTFALELAYIMEHFGDDSEEESRLILDLYLKGAQSLMLAVSYAQRANDHSSVLWNILINHCLSNTKGNSPSFDDIKDKQRVGSVAIDGSLFGSLLEAAALSGADLAHLVKQIPPGMAIHGLKPRLVAAVADYRLKLQMRHTSSEIASSEKIALLREVAHRSRRGMRFEKMNERRRLPSATTAGDNPDGTNEQAPVARFVWRPSQHTTKRHDRYQLAYSLPIR